MPDPDRPSAAPLSDSEADRLSERFTASWDEPEPPTAEPATLPRPEALTAAPSPQRAKPTLLGIAPIVVVGASPSKPPGSQAVSTASAAPSPAASPAAPPPRALPSEVPTAPAPPVAVTVSLTGPAAMGPPPPPAPLPAPAAGVLSGAVADAAVAPSVAPPPYASSAPSPPVSSPDSAPPPSSPVATGLTTPSKPYVPKDDPSTPAVVISDAVTTQEAKLDRARIAQTLPAQTRSAPVASQAPLGSTPFAAPSSPAALNAALDDTYPPARKRSKKLPLVLGAAAVLAVAAVAAVKLGASNASRNVAPTPPALPPAAAAPVAETPAAEVPKGPAALPLASSSESIASTLTPPPEPEPAAAATPKATRPVQKRSSVATTQKKSATKTEGRAAAPAEGPAPAKPTKGVIVRETPF